MAISTIKFDENSAPKPAKYRIVVLGHLDQNKWSKQETYAPVLSLVRILKSGDFKQAFYQAELQPDEKYEQLLSCLPIGFLSTKIMFYFISEVAQKVRNEDQDIFWITPLSSLK